MNGPTHRFDTVLEQAGLNHSVHKTAGIELSLLTSVTLFRLHSLQNCERLDACLAGNGIKLPERPNQASGQDPAVLCLAPGEWLIFSEYLNAGLLQQKFQAALEPSLTALLELSAAFGVFRLKGEIAPWLLSKSCGLDFHQLMRQGQFCTRTRLNQVPAILHHHRPGNGSTPFVIDVMTERSLAPHVWQLFLKNLPHATEVKQLHGPFYEQSKLHP